MNKSIKLIIALGLVMMATSACKTKQKVAEIPAGANVEATNTATPTVVTKPGTYETTSNETEVTRNEKFKLADGETNTEAMNSKYHVVVGSFSVQANSKGLQSTLNAEGNKSIVVVNENGMFRVLITSLNDYKLAHDRIKQIATRFPDAWVLVQK